MKEHASGPAVAPEQEAAAPKAPGRLELGGFSPTSLLTLQRTAGNAAVNRILARRERFGASETQDWTATDREGNTARWQSANEANLLAGRSGEYKSPLERSAFYRWFYIATTTHPDPARRSECRWPLAASVVAAGVWGMVDMPNTEAIAKTAGVTTEEVQTILRRGNQVIMDDVFPKLRDLWLNPRRGQAALDWDAETLAEEQNLVQPLYDSASAEANTILQNMADGTWTSAQIGAAMFAAGTVEPGPNIRGGRVPFFSGRMRDMATRWRYGNQIATTFSTLSPAGAAPASPPGVGAALLRRGHVRLAGLEAPPARVGGGDRQRDHTAGGGRRGDRGDARVHAARAAPLPRQLGLLSGAVSRGQLPRVQGASGHVDVGGEPAGADPVHRRSRDRVGERRLRIGDRRPAPDGPQCPAARP